MSDDRQPFGTWLLQQAGRGGAVQALVDQARADRSFPRNGTPDQVRARLAAGGAEGDIFDLIDDLETDWLAL